MERSSGVEHRISLVISFAFFKHYRKTLSFGVEKHQKEHSRRVGFSMQPWAAFLQGGYYARSKVSSDFVYKERFSW